MLADADEFERRYYQPRYQMQLSCEERARLIAFARRYRLMIEEGREEWRDRYVSARRVAFVQHLIATGRIGEGLAHHEQ